MQEIFLIFIIVNYTFYLPIQSCEVYKGNVAKTSKLANVPQYVKQAIRKELEDFKISRYKLQMLVLPILNYIITVCASLTSLLALLCSDLNN